MQRRNILWLVSWYPNKYNPFDGDFVQRHARAASLYDNVTVLFVKQDILQKSVEETVQYTPNLTEYIVYLPKVEGRLPSLRNYRTWRAAYRQKVPAIVSSFIPSVVHVHIPWKAGLIALWAKKTFNLPYFVTEHWGIYNNVVEDNVAKRPLLMRLALRAIFKNAAGFISVSKFLGDGVNRMIGGIPYVVVPNAVDASLFYPATVLPSVFTLLHVSNAVPLKNVGGILEAFREFMQYTGANARLVIIGNKDDRYLKLATDLGLPLSVVQFEGEVSYKEVAEWMRRSHALVLNSDMENSPCVIGEALCCGLPVLATDVGGIPELVNAENAILYPPRDAAALALAMGTMYTSWPEYNRTAIADAAREKFSYNAVGAAHHQLYLEKGG